MSYEIDIQNQQRTLAVDVEKLTSTLVRGMKAEFVASAVLSVTVVDNAAIHELNRDHLQHDYPTDVISFQLEHTGRDDAAIPDGEADSAQMFPAAGAHIEGEIVVSAEMASQVAAELGATPESELILYAIHGMLHICGYDDCDAESRELMRSREAAILG